MSPKDSKLILSEATFPIIEQITTGMPGGFFIYHADGDESLIYANQALIEMYGCGSREEFWQYTGGTFRGLVHPEDWERVSQSIHRQICQEGSDLDQVDYRIIRKDGGIRWIEDYGHFVPTEAYGDVFYVFLEDATERHLRRLNEEKMSRLAKERQEALERLEHETTALKIVHQILRSGMWAMEFDEAGQMRDVFWSDDFRAMLGYRDREDFPDRLESWSDLLHPDDKERVLAEFYGTIEDDSPDRIYDVEYRMETRDRGWRWFRATGKISRREDGTPVTYVGTFVDITERKDIDDKLLEQHTLLEEALEEAQQSDRAKTLFLNNMSHDIRTPMNAILGFTALAASHLDDRELVRDYLGKIQVSGRHLLSLFSDMLDMSRIESRKIRLEEAPCSLKELVGDLEIMVQGEIRTRGHTFTVDAGGVAHPNVICDRLRLSQVMLNVLGNAVKFTPNGGKITFTVSEEAGEEGSGRYRFRVEDTGVGMSREFQKHIFEPFERERTSTISGVQGTGLGMAITKNIVDAMDGSIQVESEAGKGSCFTIEFSFPYAQEGGGEAQEAGGPGGSLAGKRVLLVEDNELNREIAATILEEEGILVDEAWDGAAAVEKIANSAPGQYQLVLMDIQMPVMDGYEATRRIRRLADPRQAGVPILAVTANALVEDRRKALEAGMDGHLTKPIEVEKLMAELRTRLC